MRIGRISGTGLYGLGTIDLSGENAATGRRGRGVRDRPPGTDYGVDTLLVAFPLVGVVVSVQASGASIQAIEPVIDDIRASIGE